MDKYYSQYGQDRFLNEFLFKNKENGVFIDNGANDGIGFSNSYFFEKMLSWKGICIEPHIGAFCKLERNRISININGCASDRNYIDTFYNITGYGEMLSGLKYEYDERHLERINREISEHGGRITETQVQCYDLNEILIKNNFKQIDFVSIDTEGGELKILKSINYKIVKIKVIVVENNYSDPDIFTFMREKGFYRVVHLSSDEIYIHAKNFGNVRSFIIRYKLKVKYIYTKFGRLTQKLKLTLKPAVEV